MSLELLPIRTEHIPELSRICFEAFGRLQDRHGVPRDFPIIDVAQMVIGLVATRPDYFGIVAALDGKIVGSNFLQLSDEVAGVGPITVDPNVQSRGVGRKLMQHVIDESRRRGVKQVRLFQEAINATSLSLYTTLGFSWRDSGALMDAAPAAADDPSVRPMTADDLPAVAALSRSTYGHSRAGDVGVLLNLPFPAFVRTRSGKVVGYMVPSLFGHAAAESPDDLLALIGQVARRVDPPMAKFICPMSNPELFRAALAAKCRVVKLLNYMSLGEHTTPRGAWLPSIQC